MRDGLAYCLLHYELLYNYNGYCGGVKLEAAFRPEDSPGQYFGNSGGVQKGRPRKRKLSAALETTDIPISMRLPAGAIGNTGCLYSVFTGTHIEFVTVGRSARNPCASDQCLSLRGCAVQKTHCITPMQHDWFSL
jgi:hypothetical protein